MGTTRSFFELQKQVDIEPQILFINLARNNPDDEFYFLGAVGNTKNKKMFPNQNVHLFKNERHTDTFINRVPKMDFMIVYTGVSIEGVNIDNMTIDKNDPTKRQRVTFCHIAKYVGPFLKYLNHHSIKYIAFSNDPRHCEMAANDLFVRPIAQYAQSTWDIEHTRHVSYDDRTKVSFRSIATYFPTERMRVVDTKRPVLQKKHGFGIICNQGAEKGGHGKHVNKRWPILKDWLLDVTDLDFEVYGKWDKEILASDSRMKGSVDSLTLRERIKEWKYSLCIPIAQGWNTGKYSELIESGIVPFLYPGYDSQRLVNFPEILRLEKPEDLWERIDYLDKNDDEYQKLMNELFDLVYEEDWVSGKKLNELVYSYLEDDYRFRNIPSKYHKWSDYFVNDILKF